MTKPKQPHTRKREPKRRTNSYAAPDKLRAAYLAGQGRAPSHICAALGIGDTSRLRGLLRQIGVSVAAEGSIAVSLSRETLDALELMADRANLAPDDFAARILTLMVMDEPTILRNLLAGGDE